MSGWKLKLLIVEPGPSTLGFTNETVCSNCKETIHVSDDVISQHARIICGDCWDEDASDAGASVDDSIRKGRAR